MNEFAATHWMPEEQTIAKLRSPLTQQVSPGSTSISIRSAGPTPRPNRLGLALAGGLHDAAIARSRDVEIGGSFARAEDRAPVHLGHRRA